MTRKMALQQAIQALSKDKEYSKVVELLQDICNELPLIHWSDKSIRDTIEQFIIDNGRVPTATDFKRKGMPPHPVIKQKYKINLSQWLNENYPTKRLTNEEITKKYTKDFIDEFNRIQPKYSNEYNQNKNKELPTWNTVAKWNDVTSWRALLKKLDLKIYYREYERKVAKDLKVNIYSDYT